MRACLAAVLVLGSACATARASIRAGAEARAICEAECRRDARCGDASPDCLPRCGSLPLDAPPVWRGDWASAVAGCTDHSSCSHDADESCVFAYSKIHTKAADACYASGMQIGDCGILNGLTPSADQKVSACLAAGQPGGTSCMPALDWK